ncbi:MAG: hypothetical protein PHO67_06965 [Candidatus Omnitrophica bacterium]|nr:hypothetical protein [Candidatus Omnitrophota bacterium]
MENIGNKLTRQERKKEAVRQYCILRRGVEEIARSLGCHKSQVYNYVNAAKEDVLNEIKKDLRINNKIINHMIMLTMQLDLQIEEAWRKYNELEKLSATSIAILRQVQESNRAGSDTKPASISEVTGLSRNLLAIHGTQQRYLVIFKQQLLTMLEIWDRFGLAGEDALKLVFSGGVDIEAKAKDMRQNIINLIEIIKFEVKDAQIRKNIFGRLANEIKTRSLRAQDGSSDKRP